MTDTMLPRGQALALLQRLATDDAFRATYQASPAAALKAAGIPAEIVDGLASTSLSPATLRPREVFEQAYRQVRDEAAAVCLCHRPPEIRLHPAKGTRGTDDGATTPFAEP